MEQSSELKLTLKIVCWKHRNFSFDVRNFFLKALGKDACRQTLDFHEFTFACDWSKQGGTSLACKSEPFSWNSWQAQRGLFEVVLENFLIFTLRWLKNDLDLNKGTETSSPNSGTKSHRSTTSTTTLICGLLFSLTAVDAPSNFGGRKFAGLGLKMKWNYSQEGDRAARKWKFNIFLVLSDWIKSSNRNFLAGLRFTIAPNSFKWFAVSSGFSSKQQHQLLIIPDVLQIMKP